MVIPGVCLQCQIILIYDVAMIGIGSLVSTSGGLLSLVAFRVCLLYNLVHYDCSYIRVIRWTVKVTTIGMSRLHSST